MALNEKQIYNRLNRFYENNMGTDNFDTLNDEWYGTDDPREWKFYRPSDETTYMLILNEDKSVTVFVKEKEAWGFVKGAVMHLNVFTRHHVLLI